MINNIVSLYRSGAPPGDDCSDDERTIATEQPLYATATVLDLARQVRVRPWSTGAIADQQKWTLSNERIAELICAALQTGRYLGAEWCYGRKGGPWAACDVYVVQVKEWNEYAQKELNVGYYLKFAIGKTGQILITASNHPENT